MILSQTIIRPPPGLPQGTVLPAGPAGPQGPQGVPGPAMDLDAFIDLFLALPPSVVIAMVKAAYLALPPTPPSGPNEPWRHNGVIEFTPES